jgi:hypothetical protein
MVANLNHAAIQSGSKTLQANQHGCQVCHDCSSGVITLAQNRRVKDLCRRFPLMNADK